MITCGAYPPAIMVCGALVNTVGAGTVVRACIPQPQSKGEIRRWTWFSVRTRLAKPIFRRISHFRYRQKWSVAFRGGKTRLSALSPKKVEEMSTSEPSKVIHMRNLPEECNEMDIRSLCSQYGNVDRLNSPSPLEPQSREAHQKTKRIHRS